MTEIKQEFVKSLTEHLRESVREFTQEYGDVTPAELSIACSTLVHHVMSNSKRRIDRGD